MTAICINETLPDVSWQHCFLCCSSWSSAQTLKSNLLVAFSGLPGCFLLWPISSTFSNILTTHLLQGILSFFRWPEEKSTNIWWICNYPLFQEEYPQFNTITWTMDVHRKLCSLPYRAMQLFSSKENQTLGEEDAAAVGTYCWMPSCFLLLSRRRAASYSALSMLLQKRLKKLWSTLG